MKIGNTFNKLTTRAGLLAAGGLMAGTLVFGVAGTSQASANDWNDWNGGRGGYYNRYDRYDRYDRYHNRDGVRVIRVEHRGDRVVVIIFSNGDRRFERW